MLPHDTVTSSQGRRYRCAVRQSALIRKLDLLLPAPGNILGQRKARGDSRFRLRLAGLVEEQGLAHVLDLGDGALEVESLGQDDLEDL